VPRTPEHPQVDALSAGIEAQARTSAFSGSASAGYGSIVGNAGLCTDQGEGNTMMIAAPGRSVIYHDFMQFTFSGHATNAIDGFQLDFEVWYDGDADAALRTANQDTIALLTT
jgi:hypothetical protein